MSGPGSYSMLTEYRYPDVWSQQTLERLLELSSSTSVMLAYQVSKPDCRSNSTVLKREFTVIYSWPSLKLCRAKVKSPSLDWNFTKLRKILRKELDLSVDEEHFWYHSKIVLGFIANDGKKFHVDVANRAERDQGVLKGKYVETNPRESQSWWSSVSWSPVQPTQKPAPSLMCKKSLDKCQTSTQRQSQLRLTLKIPRWKLWRQSYLQQQ